MIRLLGFSFQEIQLKRVVWTVGLELHKAHELEVVQLGPSGDPRHHVAKPQ